MDQFDPNNPNKPVNPNQPQPVPQPNGDPNLASRAKQTGTGFTNLSRIIGANKSNQLASTVGGGVGSQVNQAKSGIQSSLSRFEQQANANKIATDENKQKAQTLINDPTKATDEDAKQFETFRSGRYDGPNELENKQQLTNQANQANTLGQMAGSSEGRQGLLERFVGGAGYTQGKKRLDSMLLGQSGNQQLKDAYRGARGLEQQLNSANMTAEEQSKMIAAQNQQFADQTKGALNNNINQIYDSGQSRMADWLKSQGELMEGITTAGKFDPNKTDVNLTQEQYDALNGTGLNLNNPYIYNTNLGDIISKSGFNPTLASALRNDDATRAQALAKLYGNDINEKGTNLLSVIKDPSQLGTLDTAKKIDANQLALDNNIRDAQEAMLKNYFNEFANPNTSSTSLHDWDRIGGDKFLDNIKRRGVLYGRVNTDEAFSKPVGNLNANPYDTTVLTRNASNPNNLMSWIDAGAGVNHAKNLADIKDVYNTGAEYSTKTNLEKAIDALRAGDTLNSAAIDQIRAQGSNNWWADSKSKQDAITDTQEGIMGPSSLPGYLTGRGFNQYANQFGRLRKIINPSGKK